MKALLEKIDSFIDRQGFKRLALLTLALIFVLLLNLTWSIWNQIYSMIILILKPFIIGFGFAYLIRPAVVFFEKKHISRRFSVPLMITAFILVFVFLLASLMPSLIEDLSQLFANFGDGIQSLYQWYLEQGNNVPSPIISNVVDQLVKASDNLIQSIPNIPLILSSSITSIISGITTSLFSFVIGLYCIMDYERIADFTMEQAKGLSDKLYLSLQVINESVRTYLSSLLVIMLITCIEYSLFYFVVGHKYALIMGILCAFGLLVPYVGSIAVNTLGLISGLGLGTPRIIMIVLGLLILPNLDSYLISPIVYKKRNAANPLWSLFSFFACASLFGFVGVLLSTPLYFSIRAVLQLRKNNWTLEK